MAVQPLDLARLAQKFVLTPEEAADFLGVSVRTIRYWVAERKIPYFILGDSSGSSQPSWWRSWTPVALIPLIGERSPSRFN
jgi:excisionase family DNA binding protein